MKKTILFLSVSLMLLYTLSGCKKKNATTVATPLSGSWTASADFEGVTRSNAVAFTINNKAYMGTGFSGTSRLQDFWEFDGTTWTQKMSVPGNPREKAAGFCIGDTGYLGTGYDGTNLLKDFYAYDHQLDNWIVKPDFKGSARFGAVSFVLDTTLLGTGNTSGFIGTGFDGNYKNDIYKYSPSRSSWDKVASLVKKTSQAVSFVINNQAYICSGVDNGTFVNEVSQYDPMLNTWTVRTYLSTSLGDARRSNAVGFTLNGLGYISCGTYGGILASTWAFNPSDYSLTQVLDMAGGIRMDAVAFTFNNRAFVATGRNNNARFDDVWEFKP